MPKPYFVASKRLYTKRAGYILQEDPLVDDRIFSTDSTTSNTATPLFGGAEIISFLPRFDMCIIAKKHDEKFTTRNQPVLLRKTPQPLKVIFAWQHPAYS